MAENTISSSVKYNYEFSVWPNENHWRNNSPAVFKVFEYLKGRVEMEFTQEEFEAFRLELGYAGFNLREIERKPYHNPEKVP